MVVASKVVLPQELVEKLTCDVSKALGRGLGARTLAGYGRARAVECSKALCA